MRDTLLSNGGWLLRVLTMTILVIVVALSLFPRVVSHISTSAVVNAPILIIRSPIEGLVEEFTLESGAVVSEGQDIVVFREAGTDLTQRADLEARLAISIGATDAVEGRIREVEEVQNRLRSRHDIFRKWHAAILEREIDELEAQQRRALARLSAVEAEVARASELHRRKMIPESENLEVATRLTEQAEFVQELSARISVRRLKLGAMRHDVLAGTDGTNTPYTLQRQDEVALELARLRDELIDHRAERAALEEQLRKELQIYESENRIALASPIAGVVWRSSSLSGRPVLPGDEIVEILDCGARFLEAYLPEGLIGTISVGDLAEIQLTGETSSFSAPIVSILGNGARFDHVQLAAKDTAPKTGKMRVLIELGVEALAFDRERFCHVGRTAQVSLPRDLTGLKKIVARFSTSVKTAFAWVESTAANFQRG